MSQRLSLFLLTFMLVAIVGDAASAAPRWRRNRQTTYYSSGWLQVASKVDESSLEYPPLSVYCSYDRANAEEDAFEDQIRIYSEVWDARVLEATENLVAEVKITDVSDSSVSHVRYLPFRLADVEDAEYKLATLDIVNECEQDLLLQPAKIYRVFVNLHREAGEYGKESVIGRLPGAYYAATSGSSVVEQARQRIVMKTFREWYYKERGWNRNATYPMDCHAYYRWATGACTVGSTNGWANLGRIFRKGYHGGGNIPELMEKGPIHGDYVRKPGHTFMLLAYDAEKRHVWTMEANFNHTIEVVVRQIGSDWTVGHLAMEDIDHEVFQVRSEAEKEADDRMAQNNTTASESVPETAVQ